MASPNTLYGWHHLPDDLKRVIIAHYLCHDTARFFRNKRKLSLVCQQFYNILNSERLLIEVGQLYSLHIPRIEIKNDSAIDHALYSGNYEVRINSSGEMCMIDHATVKTIRLQSCPVSVDGLEIFEISSGLLLYNKKTNEAALLYNRRWLLIRGPIFWNSCFPTYHGIHVLVFDSTALRKALCLFVPWKEYDTNFVVQLNNSKFIIKTKIGLRPLRWTSTGTPVTLMIDVFGGLNIYDSERNTVIYKARNTHPGINNVLIGLGDIAVWDEQVIYIKTGEVIMHCKCVNRISRIGDRYMLHCT